MGAVKYRKRGYVVHAIRDGELVHSATYGDETMALRIARKYRADGCYVTLIKQMVAIDW